MDLALRIEMSEYGAPEVLRPASYEPRALEADEVAVRAELAGVNRADCFIRSGAWPHKGSFPYVPGLETCGVVERVGADVTSVRPGDAVITMMQRLGGVHGSRPGGYQEVVIVPASTLVVVPAPLTIADAAALGLPAVTAWLALKAIDAKPGERVLVAGAASAVGLMAVQLMKARGAAVVGTSRRQATFEAIRAAGADVALSLDDEQAHREIGEVDAVFDLIGAAAFAPCLARLKPGGRYVYVGGASGGDLAVSGWDLMRPITLTGYSSETLDAAELGATLRELAGLVEDRAIAVLSPTVYPLADVARAHADMESGRVVGRVLLACG